MATVHRLDGNDNGAGRDANGRFTKGNPGGPGRPRRKTERDYLAALSDACSIDDWRKIVAKAVLDAKQGDATARAWLSKYLVGEVTTLHQLAVESQADVDPVGEDARIATLLSASFPFND